MNLWLRLLWMFATIRSRGSIALPHGVSRVTMRVWPTDLDFNMHMNNARFLAAMDVGRVDYFVRSGLLKVARANGWAPIMSSLAVRFRRELRNFARFHVDTRLLYWADQGTVLEHRIVVRDAQGAETTAALAYMRGGFYDRRARAFVPPQRLMQALDLASDPPPLQDDVRAMLDADDALRRMM